MIVRDYLKAIVVLCSLSSSVNGADLTLQVGDHTTLFDFSASKLESVDFPEVQADANLTFTLDASNWTKHDSESVAIGFSIEREDKTETTATDEYRRALMVIYPLKVSNGVISIQSSTQVLGWGWLDSNADTIVWSDPKSNVADFVEIKGEQLQIDYHGLRKAVGRDGVSNPNQFNWNYRLLWSSQLISTTSVSTLSEQEVKQTWLPYANRSDFVSPFTGGEGVYGSFSVGKPGVKSTTITNSLQPGWNLVIPSYDILVGSEGINSAQIEVLWEIDSACSNATCQMFTELSPTTINMLSKGNAYWLKLVGEEPVQIQRDILNAGTPVTHTGVDWSLYGVTTETAAIDVLQTLSIEALWGWDPEREQWRSAVDGVPIFLNSLQQLQPGQGYYFPSP